jgi:hypothetical protein
MCVIAVVGPAPCQCFSPGKEAKVNKRRHEALPRRPDFRNADLLVPSHNLKFENFLEDTIYEECLVGYSFADGERATCLC